MTAGVRALDELMDPTWAEALASQEGTIRQLGDFLRAEISAGRGYQPAGAHVLRAFSLPLPAVKVLLVGQDPYPTPGHAVGLSFAVPPGTDPLPRSLVNIATELRADLGCELPSDLSVWLDEGVLLLNRVLTVRPGASGAHRGKGWEQVTDAAVAALAARAGPLVAILWGRDAQGAAARLPGVPVIASAHPSPLSAARGFFGSRPFSRANQALAAQGAAPVRWCVGAAPAMG
jgi:uracil-DNA glycosylase